jgi:hypothetical protein
MENGFILRKEKKKLYHAWGNLQRQTNIPLAGVLEII